MRSTERLASASITISRRIRVRSICWKKPSIESLVLPMPILLFTFPTTTTFFDDLPYTPAICTQCSQRQTSKCSLRVKTVLVVSAYAISLIQLYPSLLPHVPGISNTIATPHSLRNPCLAQISTAFFLNSLSLVICMILASV